MTSLSDALLEIDNINTKEGLIDLLERIDITSKNTSAYAKTVLSLVTTVSVVMRTSH